MDAGEGDIRPLQEPLAIRKERSRHRVPNRSDNMLEIAHSARRRSGPIAACGPAVSDDRRHPNSRGKAISTLELSRHVALIGKPGLDRGLDERRPVLQQSPDMIQLPHDAEAAGTGAVCRAELTGERPTVETGQPFKLIHRVPFGRSSDDQVPNPRQAAERKRAGCPRCARSSTDKQIRHRVHQFDPRDVVHVLIEVPDIGSTARRHTRRAQHGMSDKWQRITVERVLD